YLGNIFLLCIDCFFFFQAEDGIRDYKVTGVQTCALPISLEIFEHRATPVAQVLQLLRRNASAAVEREDDVERKLFEADEVHLLRSEERRVGKECRSRWSRDH